jgi:squalene-associated FAD-dependent desaturase
VLSANCSFPEGRRAAPADPAAVAVIGGGWAGCAAAVTLAQAGHRVTLFEQAATLGGRARRVAVDRLVVDNGQHVLIGAYRQTLDLLAIVHGGHTAALLNRLPLTLAPFGTATRGAPALRAWRVPAPLHLAAAIVTARGLAWRDRIALVRGFRRLALAGFRCPPGQTVADCFAATPAAAMNGVWTPLCLAALNTPPQRASAQVFANVLRETFTTRADASDFLIPIVDLSSLFPDAAARHVVARGGEIRTGTAAACVAADTTAITIRTNRGDERFAAAIVAVGPHQLAASLERVHGANGSDCGNEPWQTAVTQVAALAHESITTAYLAYPAPVPLPAPIARLDDAPGQWVFDRSAALASSGASDAASLLAVVISASGPHDALDQRTLALQIDAQLRRLLPALPALSWSRVIAERRATYACTPALARPSAGRIAHRLYVAGDYTLADLPPTLEAATRSGVIAARAAHEDLSRGI